MTQRRPELTLRACHQACEASRRCKLRETVTAGSRLANVQVFSSSVVVNTYAGAAVT